MVYSVDVYDKNGKVASKFDFNGDIYGEKLTVLWLDKIRDMIKFDGIDQLIKQMKEDEQIARDFKA